MATATSTYTWATYGAALKAYLGITGSAEDTNLTAWLAAAAADCDDYVGHDWTDDDGADVDHSALVPLGIYTWVGTMRAWHARRDAPGVASVTTGGWSESYALAMGQGIASARVLAYPFWMGSVKNILATAAG
jgi:hypothetical protein